MSTEPGQHGRADIKVPTAGPTGQGFPALPWLPTQPTAHPVPRGAEAG